MWYGKLILPDVQVDNLNSAELCSSFIPVNTGEFFACCLTQAFNSCLQFHNSSVLFSPNCSSTLTMRSLEEQLE